ILHFQGGGLLCLPTVLLLVSLGTLLLMGMQSHPDQYAYSEEHCTP
ncbi:unnamed protein product, partial [Staurois parvus]